MGYSTEVRAIIVMILSQVLPLIGVEFSSEAINTTLQVIIGVGAGVWIWYRKVSKDQIDALGFRK